MTTQVTSSTLLPEQEFAKACELTFKAFDTDRDQILSKKEFNVLLAQVRLTCMVSNFDLQRANDAVQLQDSGV